MPVSPNNALFGLICKSPIFIGNSCLSYKIVEFTKL
jgi:hypothetical protein